MATLLTCQSISKHFGARQLFDGLSISFADDERVGFLGPNGAGKTTFLKILADLEHADTGAINRRRGARIGFIPQEDRFPDDATVESVLLEALADQHMEEHDRQTQVNIQATQFGFDDAAQPVHTLSGGWRKRLALARGMIRQPDLLLMDEPTNHLDLTGITWLEDLLAAADFAFLAVSHDRYFLQRVTNRVVELNPIYADGYFSVSGDYALFLEKRADFLSAQLSQQETLANIARREAAFLKSNSKAQRTKSKWRIDGAHQLQDDLRELTNRNTAATTAGINFEGTGRKSTKLLEAKNLSKSIGDKNLFAGVDVFLSPGARLGILGANGSGKTTLIRVLTGDLPSDTGSIQRAEHLRVVVFDQKREQLDQQVTLREALAGRHDTVDFHGRAVHITAWAKRFLFQLDQLNTPVNALSGGEQARILIARLMLQPADVLVLDEPTNDLDIASLDVLEESLTEFPGAIVLVTHDRFMLDRVCDDILGLDGDGQVGRYIDCAQWQSAQTKQLRVRDREKAAKRDAQRTATGGLKPSQLKPQSQSDNLTGSERKELARMEVTIQDAEARVEACRQAVDDPAMANNHTEAMARWQALEEARKHVEQLYARWEALEQKAN
jgi:ATP-binding cassette subfamily F protein uup